MKLVITVETKKLDGPVPTFEALQEALSDELDGYTLESQNEGSDQISLVELADVTVERAP